jgi:hypothetical protein
MNSSQKARTAKNSSSTGAKASMLEYLKSRTWPERVRSMERMNEATKIAREAMREAQAAQVDFR